MEASLELLTKISDQLGELIELQKRIPLIYSVNMGDIMQLANAPAQVFNPEFLERLAVELPQMVKAVAAPKEIDLTKSGDYKKKIHVPATEYKA